MDSATSKFQQNYLAALHLVSPSFAALHAARARSRLSALHCPRCSRLAVTTRLVSSTKRKALSLATRGPRVRTVCAACGFTTSTRPDADALAVQRSALADKPRCHAASPSQAALPASTPVELPHDSHKKPDTSTGGSRANLKSKARALADNSSPSSTPMASSEPVSAPMQSASSSSKRSRKKAGLQEMLVRSKEKNVQRKGNEGQVGDGLVAFLSGL